jgi:uncharacterized protein
MHPAEILEKFIELQRADSALDDLAKMRQEVLDTLDLMQAKLKAFEERMAAEKKNQENLAKTRKTLEIEIGAKDTLVSKYQNQLLEVKSNEQYQALQHEIDKAKQDKAQLEEKVLETMFREDELKAGIQKLAKMIEEDRKKLAVERQSLEAKLAETEKSAENKKKEREDFFNKAAEEIPRDLEGYTAIRKGGKKVAVAKILDGETCEGCRMSVPPQTLQEVRRGIQMVRCSCGRFLYEAEG